MKTLLTLLCAMLLAASVPALSAEKDAKAATAATKTAATATSAPTAPAATATTKSAATAPAPAAASKPAPAASATMAATKPATAAAAATAATTAKADDKLDINRAKVEDLMKLEGIGDVRAKAIVKGRPYKGKDELVAKNIIPQGVYDKITDKIIAKQK